MSYCLDNMEKHAELFQCTLAADSFKFKYVAEEELLQIVRKVRRAKQKEKDDLMWKQFVENKEKLKTREGEQVGHVQQLPVSPVCNNCHQVSEKCAETSYKNVKAPIEAEVDLKSIPLDILEPNLPSKQSLVTDSGASARETGTLQRIALLRHRISLSLDSITGMVQCQPSEPDGPDDFERRKIRINEFLSRFSRNYLFQFQRQVAELRRNLASASPETPGRHTEHQALMQKLVSAHQTAMQSLQAYLTQIPASLQGTNMFGKLKDLLHHLCDLSSLKYQLDIHAGMMNISENIEDCDEVYIKCKELLSLLKERQMEMEDNNFSARTSSPLSARGSSYPRVQQGNRHRGALHTASWKKSSAYLAQAKFGPPSSVRSSCSPHVSSIRNINSEKLAKHSHAHSCCNENLQDFISHMHDILCNKMIPMNKKKTSHHAKASKEKDAVSRKKTKGSQTPFTEVRNLSKNVQLVITRHCEIDDKRHQDAATDTIDLNCGSSQLNSEEIKRMKKVIWAAGEPMPLKGLDGFNSENINAETHSISSSQLEGKSSNKGHHSSIHPKAPQQRVLGYRQRFEEYNSRVKDPIIQSSCDNILDCVFKEISQDLEPSILLEKMYHLEFKDS